MEHSSIHGVAVDELAAELNKIIKKEAIEPEVEEFNYEALEALMHFRPTKEQCSFILRIPTTTLDRRISERYNGMNFTELRNHLFDGSIFKLQLQQVAAKKALKGDAYFLGLALKNFCGWEDQPKKKLDDQRPLQITIDSDDAEL